MEDEFDEILEQVNGHHFWLTYLLDAARPKSRIGIHLAIFAEPFLSMVLSGEKTIESRFSRNRCAPYGEIADGDIILLKEVAGPICGIAFARNIWCYYLGIESIDRIRHRFGVGIRADDEFWSARADALYATLIELDAPASIAPVRCDKRDRRGWVSLRSRQMTLNFT
ncbi:ASCH domain-containing protein [Chelativorans xinjiangense]|uniref:ASCH domain-containing protein n=1 Tax=Chelativorans xinjiangense TaxID=2681485 RepID=UPI0013585957|nr:ASCH domain-containing protein [Chelativorans xinjiangense]